MVKLLENIHRSINIGLVNELKVVADAMDLDIFEIIDAAKTKPFGFTAYYPGPGIGGHCIPIDPFYLTWKAREFGCIRDLLSWRARLMRQCHCMWWKRLSEHSTRWQELERCKGSRSGIAYKRDVDDMRESPSVFVMEHLRDWGADVHYSDPNVPVFPEMREHDFDLSSVDLSPEALGEYDAVVLLTDHTGFDYEMIKTNAKLLIDTRGKYRDTKNGDHIWRA